MPDQDPQHNGRTAAELASDAENALRGIVHLTEADERPLSPESIHRTLSGVTRMVEHLPEVVTRLRAAMLTHQQNGPLSVLGGPFARDPDAALSVMSDAVDDFLTAYGPALTSLERAQGALSEVHPSDA